MVSMARFCILRGPIAAADPAVSPRLRIDVGVRAVSYSDRPPTLAAERLPTSTSEPAGPVFAVERSPRLRLLIPITVAIGFAMEQLDTTIITTAIPAMARTLHATPLHLSLAVTTYVLVLAVFVPVSGCSPTASAPAWCSPSRCSPSRSARCSAASPSICRCWSPRAPCRASAAR